VFGELDLGKVSFADGLEEAVLADVRLLARAPGRDSRRAAIATLKERYKTVSISLFQRGHFRTLCILGYNHVCTVFVVSSQSCYENFLVKNLPTFITRCDFVAYGQGMQKTLQRFFMK
jgi:hypothetical protein